MEITELLQEDHAAIDELFRRVNLSERDDSIAGLTRQIVHDLSVHAAIEEQFVYPLIRLRVKGGNGLVREAIAEHAAAKRLLADLEKAPVGSAAHDKAMTELIESVRHHVDEEENEALPELRRAVGSDLRNGMGTLAERAKSFVPTHPHPLVPGTATAQLVAGPWATIIDKVRDLVTPEPVA